MKEDNLIIESRAEQLAEKIESLVVEARKNVAVVANTAMVYTYYEIGRYIVEDEQGGKERAEYGKSVLKSVSLRLTERFGTGWSYSNLKNIRQFYIMYSKRLTTGWPIQTEKANHWLTNSTGIQKSATTQRKFVLPWTHYLILTHVSNPDARSFYEIEAFKQQWSKRQLQRHIGSGLYERLALSKNKNEVVRLAAEGQVVEKPTDIIKDPLVLEFIGLKPDASYSETDLESAIISRLQDFLLEMGKGFLFEARQKRFTFEERHFYLTLYYITDCYRHTSSLTSKWMTSLTRI